MTTLVVAHIFAIDFVTMIFYALGILVFFSLALSFAFRESETDELFWLIVAAAATILLLFVAAIFDPPSILDLLDVPFPVR